MARISQRVLLENSVGILGKFPAWFFPEVLAGNLPRNHFDILSGISQGFFHGFSRTSSKDSSSFSSGTSFDVFWESFRNSSKVFSRCFYRIPTEFFSRIPSGIIPGISFRIFQVVSPNILPGIPILNSIRIFIWNYSKKKSWNFSRECFWNSSRDSFQHSNRNSKFL